MGLDGVDAESCLKLLFNESGDFLNSEFVLWTSKASFPSLHSAVSSLGMCLGCSLPSADPEVLLFLVLVREWKRVFSWKDTDSKAKQRVDFELCPALPDHLVENTKLCFQNNKSSTFDFKNLIEETELKKTSFGFDKRVEFTLFLLTQRPGT